MALAPTDFMLYDDIGASVRAFNLLERNSFHQLSIAKAGLFV